MTSEARKKAAGKRVFKAEALLSCAAELMEKAQAELSVVVGGLNQNYAKIGSLRVKVKEQGYDLLRCWETGLCDLDETTARRTK
jgi:hypothetical protein